MWAHKERRERRHQILRYRIKHTFRNKYAPLIRVTDSASHFTTVWVIRRAHSAYSKLRGHAL